MKVLVTGGAGFIGSQVAAAYALHGHSVVVVDDLSVGRRANVPAGVGFHQMRVQDRTISLLFDRERFDVVNHHAAHISVTESMANPLADAESNVMGTVNLLECAVRYGVTRFIFAGSGGATYGECRFPGADEDAPLLPESPYGISKMAAEQYLFRYAVPHGVNAVSLRYANVYGPHVEPAGETGVVTLFAHSLVAGESLTVFGDGEQTRDFIFLDDVVDANVRALTCLKSGCFNVSTGISTSVNELLVLMMTLHGSSVPVEYRPPRPGEIRHSCLNPARAAVGLGWQPRTSLRDGLSRVLTLAGRRGQARRSP